MSEKIDKIMDVQIIAEPLKIVFFYESGNTKAGSIDTLNQSEWDITLQGEGRKLPDDREEPFFTSSEVVAAKRALREHKILLA